MVGFDECDVERHRGFLHSSLGLGTLTVLSAVYLLPVLFLLGLLWIPGILLFMAGYLGGAPPGGGQLREDGKSSGTSRSPAGG